MNLKVLLKHQAAVFQYSARIAVHTDKSAGKPGETVKTNEKYNISSIKYWSYSGGGKL